MNRRDFFRKTAIAGMGVYLASSGVVSGYEFCQEADEGALTFSDIVRATLHKRRHEVAANIAANNALLQRLNQAGKV